LAKYAIYKEKKWLSFAIKIDLFLCLRFDNLFNALKEVENTGGAHSVKNLVASLFVLYYSGIFKDTQMP
jgi:hypothetical protein